MYAEEGVHFLARFYRNRNDQTFTEALLAHWDDLANGLPPYAPPFLPPTALSSWL
jgi:hypothetical protein